MANVTNLLSRVQPHHMPTSSATPAQKTTGGASVFRALLKDSSGAAPHTAISAGPAALQSSVAPTAQSVFGAAPWQANPVGFNPDGSQFSYNPIYFATASTAQQVAQMLGGSVIQSNALAPNAQQQPNLMVHMPDGRNINAGLIASFYTHGYPQSYVDGLIQRQIDGTAT